MQKVAVDLVKVLGEFDPKQMVIEAAPLIAEEMEREARVAEALNKKK